MHHLHENIDHSQCKIYLEPSTILGDIYLQLAAMNKFSIDRLDYW
ncbi:unnamed protein product [Nezara viridula]|uniref:Uncharacterized protein n=1 Tax=Nezara viridula TaxID=85310 RepID=A0A9P0HSN5_NEZVI|nr:unnamed protein product [Nezara viridula]